MKRCTISSTRWIGSSRASTPISRIGNSRWRITATEPGSSSGSRFTSTSRETPRIPGGRRKRVRTRKWPRLEQRNLRSVVGRPTLQRAGLPTKFTSLPEPAAHRAPTWTSRPSSSSGDASAILTKATNTTKRVRRTWMRSRNGKVRNEAARTLPPTNPASVAMKNRSSLTPARRTGTPEGNRPRRGEESCPATPISAVSRRAERLFPGSES